MKVFLATDGSASALAAEQLLARFPFAERPELIIATVCPAADLVTLEAELTAPVAMMLQDYRREAQGLLDEVERRSRPWSASCRTLLLDGHPADELLKALEQIDPDLVVVGARGLGAVRRFLLGSVSERIVKHAPCSVLVAHQPEGRSDIDSIVLAYDHSAASAGALARFAKLPLGSHRRLHLVSVVETVRIYGTELPLASSEGVDAARHACLIRLQAAAAVLGQQTGQVTTEVHASSDVAADVLRTAEEWRADLIVLGSRGKSAWQRFLLGSTSLRVLHQASCSVWIERVPE